ncbi:MAG: FIST signal transduction protein [Solirubrobacterales bacterium]
MPARIAVGLSDSFDAVEAFSDAAEQARRGLDGAACDLCLIFAGAPHLIHAKSLLGAVQEILQPPSLLGCGAGGVVGPGRELESGPGAVVWAASLPEATIATHHLDVEPDEDASALVGVPGPEQPAEALIVLADPNTFPADALLAGLNEDRPGMPVLGGLASASAAGSAALFRDGEVRDTGAVACSIAGASLLPCVSQGASPVGPEMTITAAEGNVIEELASAPAIDRLREAIGALPPTEQALAAGGLMLGLVIDENQPEYERGDFLVRPLIGADPESGSVAIGESVRVGQTVRMHVRDGTSADEDLREALRPRVEALGPVAGALLFTCNGRGAHMFAAPDHDATTIGDMISAPVGGFFCAGEIGPVGGRNFLHGFTATLALFPAD